MSNPAVGPTPRSVERAVVSTEERAELLAIADPTALVTMGELCIGEYGDPSMLVPPETGLVVMQVREPVCDERFHLGEVVVTRAEVEIAGCRGWAMRMGTDRVATLAAAVCDAVAESGGALSDDVIELCLATRRRLADERDREWAELALTEVTFTELD